MNDELDFVICVMSGWKFFNAKERSERVGLLFSRKQVAVAAFVLQRHRLGISDRKWKPHSHKIPTLPTATLYCHRRRFGPPSTVPWASRRKIPYPTPAGSTTSAMRFSPFSGPLIASTSGPFSVTLAPSLAFAPMLWHQQLGFQCSQFFCVLGR
ncbi:hypothetical protein GQ457_02G017630 [Hibiscus cannabinus]